MAVVRFRSVILTLQDLTEPRWVRALADAGLNTLMLHAVRLPHDIEQLLTFADSTAGRRLRQECRDFGVLLEYQMHTATWLVPRALFHSRPHLFRMTRQGQRSPDCNFCVSDEEAWAIAARRVQRLVEALPSDTHRYLLFADDVSEGACHCPACAHLSASDQALIYANRLLRSIRAVDPQATVSYLAYHATLEPPTTGAPDDGVFVEFAPHRRCYRHALDDPGCAVNRGQADALRRLLAFSQHAPFHVTEYWLDASLHSAYRRPAVRVPVGPRVIEQDVRFYIACGADSIATYAVMCDEEYWAAFGPPPLREYGAALRAQA